MEQRLEGGKVPGCKFRVPTRPGAPAEKGVVLSTGSGSCPSLPARWGRPVGLSGACLGLTHSAPPRPPLRLAPGLFRGGAAGRCCVLKATAGVGVQWGRGATGPRNRAGAVCGRGTRPGLRTVSSRPQPCRGQGAAGAGGAPGGSAQLPAGFPVPFALSPLRIHPPRPPVAAAHLGPAALSLFLNSQAPALSSRSETVPFPLLEGGGTPDPHLGSVSKDTAAVSTPGLPRAQHPHGCMCLGLWDLGWGMGVMSPPTSCLGGGTPVSDLIQPCTSRPRGM